MRVFVTGGTGLVGRHVIEQLRARGDTVLGLSRSAASDGVLGRLGAESLRGDVSENEVIERGVTSCDATVHAAAIILKGGRWEDFYANNVGPTQAVARVCARAGKRLVHISSASVYGRARTYDGGAGTVSEAFGLDKPIYPGDHYARSKREAEQAVWRIAESDGLSAVAVRPCVIYGEGDRTFSPRVAKALKRFIAPQIGDGTNLLSVVYAGNVAAAVLAALDRPQVRGPFNVMNDGGISQRDFVAHFAAGLGVSPRLVRVPRALAWHGARLADALLQATGPRSSMIMLKGAVQFLANENPYDSSKAERELGWRPLVAPADAAERTGRWFKDQAA